MAIYKADCKKCTYVLTRGNEQWCKAMCEGYRGMHIVSGTCGQDFVFDCDYFTEEKMQLEMYIQEIHDIKKYTEVE